MLLDVRASVATVENALHLKMHSYRHPADARTFYAPDREPTPTAGVPLLHISGLDNYALPHPRSHRQGAATRLGGSQAGSGPLGSFVGNDFRKAYVPGTTLTGQGETVGLFALDGYYLNDILTYESENGLPNVPLQQVLIGGFDGLPWPLGGGNTEVALDIEMTVRWRRGYRRSSSMRDGQIRARLTSTASLTAWPRTTWPNNSVVPGDLISTSPQQIFQQFAAQGQSFFLASGDDGAFGGVVLQPSDNPYVTVVGGTTLVTDSSGAWSSEDTWSGSGGGISTIFQFLTTSRVWR